MASAGPSMGSDRPAEAMDDLFDYTVDMEEVMRDVDVNMDAPADRQATQPKPKEGGEGLGVDKPVEVTRRRQPVAKLDEDRLLSQAGIPKLRRIAKERFIFKGKGHELWLDDLYPRAKFADGLAMIEKLGHKKRIQEMRREWIHEGKPRVKYNKADPTEESNRPTHQESEIRQRGTAGDNVEAGETLEGQKMSDLPNGNLPGVVNAKSANEETLFLPNDTTEDEPPEDDLEAWLAETANDHEQNSSIAPPPQRHTEENDFDDEEALAAMGYD
ncbi:MAG: hypothetical protein Q9169_005377 [Polycauliona sp. 2 TL-2023]